jgi:hypothetical protein
MKIQMLLAEFRKVAVCNSHPCSNGKYNNPIIAEYYQNKCKTKPAKIAHCAVMHKMSNIIFAVLRDQKPYEFRSPDEHIRLMKSAA